MANYSTIPHAAVDDSTPPAHATPWRRLVASAVVVSFVIGAIGAVAGAPLTPDALAQVPPTTRDWIEAQGRYTRVPVIRPSVDTPAQLVATSSGATLPSFAVSYDMQISSLGGLQVPTTRTPRWNSVWEEPLADRSVTITGFPEKVEIAPSSFRFSEGLYEVDEAVFNSCNVFDGHYRLLNRGTHGILPTTDPVSFTFFDYTCLDAECAPPTLYFTTGLLENDDCQNGLKFSITLPAKPPCEAEKTNLTQCLADAGCDVGGLPMARELRGPTDCLRYYHYSLDNNCQSMRNAMSRCTACEDEIQIVHECTTEHSLTNFQFASTGSWLPDGPKCDCNCFCAQDRCALAPHQCADESPFTPYDQCPGNQRDESDAACKTSAAVAVLAGVAAAAAL